MNSQILCKDCKHSFRTWSDILLMTNKQYSLRCKKVYKTNNVEKNFVTGHKPQPDHYERCSLVRMDFLSKENSATCGEAGRWWEPKQKKDLFKYIKHVGTIHG